MNTTTVISIAAAMVIAALIIFLSYQNRRLFYRCPSDHIVQPFVANPQNDKILVVYGWSEDELRKIIEEFISLYELPTGVKYLVRREGEALQVAFPEDIEPGLFAFLINYARYPKGFDPKGRAILSAGTVTLSSDFGLPSSNLVGRKAVFYVPTNDREHDLLYVRVSGQTYENSFAGKCWRPITDPRMPPAIAPLDQ